MKQRQQLSHFTGVAKCSSWSSFFFDSPAEHLIKILSDDLTVLKCYMMYFGGLKGFCCHMAISENRGAAPHRHLWFDGLIKAPSTKRIMWVCAVFSRSYVNLWKISSASFCMRVHHLLNIAPTKADQSGAWDVGCLRESSGPSALTGEAPVDRACFSIFCECFVWLRFREIRGQVSALSFLLGPSRSFWAVCQTILFSWGKLLPSGSP